MRHETIGPQPCHRCVGTFRTVEITRHANCVGIEERGRPGTGGFNIWRNTFPADELPQAGGEVLVDGVPFRFPAAGTARPDNIQCRGQTLTWPTQRVDWIYLLAAAERRTEDPLSIHYADGVRRSQWLRISDFWPETAARFGEVLAYRTGTMLYPRHVQSGMAPSIWRQRVAVTVPFEVAGVTLPDNPAMHVFALTLLREAEVTG